MSNVPQDLNYLNVNELVKVHDYAVEQSGGLMGVKDLGLLESTLHHMQNDLYYPTFVDKLSHLVFSIAKNHCFNDGNKRATVGASAMFLAQNKTMIHAEFSIDYYIRAMEPIVIFVVENLIDKDELPDILNFLVSSKADDMIAMGVVVNTLDVIREDPNRQDLTKATVWQEISNVIKYESHRQNLAREAKVYLSQMR